MSLDPTSSAVNLGSTPPTPPEAAPAVGSTSSNPPASAAQETEAKKIQEIVDSFKYEVLQTVTSKQENIGTPKEISGNPEIQKIFARFMKVMEGIAQERPPSK